MNTLKAEARSLWDKSETVVGNEEANFFNYSINRNITFLIQVPWRKLSDKCLRFSLYIEENGEDPSYAQLHISISKA